DIGRSNGVRLRSQLEADLRHDGAELALLRVNTQLYEELSHDVAVIEANRTHWNEPAVDELVATVVAGKLLQLLGGKQACGFGHTGALCSHGILASPLPPACQSGRARIHGSSQHSRPGRSASLRSRPARPYVVSARRSPPRHRPQIPVALEEQLLPSVLRHLL